MICMWAHNYGNVLFELYYQFDAIAVGFDFKGGTYDGIFVDNATSAVISIPIVRDLISNEGTEYFMARLSGHLVTSNDVAISVGDIREATVYIQEDIFLSFQAESVRVEEGQNLILTVTASPASDENFNVTLNITSNSAQCKLRNTA